MMRESSVVVVTLHPRRCNEASSVFGKINENRFSTRKKWNIFE